MPIIGPDVTVPKLGPIKHYLDHIGSKILHLPIMGPVKTQYLTQIWSQILRAYIPTYYESNNATMHLRRIVV